LLILNKKELTVKNFPSWRSWSSDCWLLISIFLLIFIWFPLSLIHLRCNLIQMIIIIYLIASFILLDCVMYSSWSSIQWRTFFKEDPLFLMVLALQPIRLRNLETLITFKENLPDKPFVLLWGNEDQTGHIQVWFYIFNESHILSNVTFKILDLSLN